MSATHDTRMDPLDLTTDGPDLALRMNAAFPGRDWVAMLMERSGYPRDYVEWYLQEEMVPPQALVSAASELLSEAGTLIAQ